MDSEEIGLRSARDAGSSASAADARALRLPDPGKVLASGEGELIHLRFLERARTMPDAIAIRGPDASFTYADVEQRSRAMAARYERLGLGRGARIAILAQRGPELIWAALGASRIGGVFILLDAAYPQGRLTALAEIARPHAIVTAGGDELSSMADEIAQARSIPSTSATLAPADMTEPSLPLDVGSPDDAAYFLFTSGTTGRPKCVAVSHRPLSHFVAWHEETFGLNASDVFTLLAGLSHDPLLRDIFTPLSIGGTLAIPRQATITDPGALTAWFHKVGATVTHLTPGMGQLLAAGAARTPQLPRLRHLFWGGDRLAPSQVASVAKLNPKAKHTNFYGSTETPQAAGFYHYEEGSPHPYLPVGHGIAGFQLLVVDADKRVVSLNVEGEIAVRSNYLSLGYVVDGELQPPTDRGLDAEGVANIYYTGDRGRYLPGGQVMIQGRNDDQVKVRGYRVDLTEITGALLAHAGVSEAMTVAVGDGADLRIVSFCAAADLSSADMLEHLASRVAAYMTPTRVHMLPALPRLPNMKMDRKALEALAAELFAAPAAAETADASADLSATERALIAKWSEIFTTPVTRNSSLISLGGDSLSYVNAFLSTEEVLSLVPAGWQEMTIAELAALRTEPNRLVTAVDTPMLVRAAAITAIVAGHFGLISYGDGGTTALFLVSGFMFGGLQLRDAMRRELDSFPLLKSVRNLLIPTLLYALFGFAYVALHHRPTTIAIPLLANDLIGYTKVPATQLEDYQCHLWYVDALIHIVLFVGLSIVVLRRWFAGKDIFRFCVTLFLFGCVTRLAIPELLEPRFLRHGVEPLSLGYFLPTTHMATFMLGAMIANAESRQTKAVTWILLGLYALITAPFFGVANAAAMAVVGALLLVASRVTVPRPLATAAIVLSGASLFIYLTHFDFGFAAAHVFGRGHPAVQTAVAIVGGLATWRAWTWLNKHASKAAAWWSARSAAQGA